MKGLFITFEGIEGCGKTTQILMLDKYLKKKGLATLLTREPGGTTIGEKIRAVLLDSGHRNMSPVAELLLYAASRNQHIFEKIAPALAGGKMVLCDRYADATEAYQGAARCLPPDTIQGVHQIATGGLMPHLTFLLDCPAEKGLARALARNARDPESRTKDRFEKEKMDFHERVRMGYLEIAKREEARVRVINATREIDEIHADIVALTEKAISSHT